MDFKQLLQNEKNMGKNPASSYTVEDLKEIDRMLFSKRNTQEKLEEIRHDAKELMAQEGALCLEYASGRIKLELRPHEFNMDLNNSLISFNNARNWDTAEWLSNLILERSSNYTAYRILGAVAHEKGDQEAMWKNYEMYAKTNHQDKDYIIDVAKHYEEKGEAKYAGIMFERALLRLDIPADHQKIVDCYTALLRSGKNETPFFLTYNERVQFVEPSLAFELYRILLGYLENEKAELSAHRDRKPSEIKANQDSILDTLKGMIGIQENAEGVYDKLVALLKEKYADSSRLAECLRKYFRTRENVLRNLNMFESEIAYSKGVFVLQKSSRRVGRIMKVTGDTLEVMYSGSEPLQTLSLDAAKDTLVPLTNHNIKAIKKGVPAPKIKAKAAADITWLTKTMIYSLTTPDTGKSYCSIKDMKNELVPHVYTDEEWKKVSELIKAEVKINPYVRIIPGPTENYELTAWPSTPDEKMLHIFKTSATFYEKAVCILESYKRKDIDRDGDALLEMGEYFEKMLEQGKLDEQVSSAIVLDIITMDGDVNILVNKSFESLYKPLTNDEKISVFSKMDSVLIKKAFVDRLVTFDKNAPEVLVLLMPYYISYVSQKLRKISKGKYYYEYLRTVFEMFRNKYEEFIYFASDISDEDLARIGMDRNGLRKTEILALQFASKLPDNADNRKSKKLLLKDVITDKGALQLINTCPDEEGPDLKTIIFFNDGIDTEDRNKLRDAILARWPQLREEKKVVKQEIKTVSGFLCTSESYDRKQAELKNLNTVEIPAILKEIAAARELGDLRENSEYQYAKDHKRELERRIGELTNDLNTVKIVKHEDVLDDMVGFGTKVTLHDNATGSEIVYTFLGRWESHPEEGILDVNAPLGKALVNHKIHEDVKFDINGKTYDYVVKNIEVIL